MSILHPIDQVQSLRTALTPRKWLAISLGVLAIIAGIGAAFAVTELGTLSLLIIPAVVIGLFAFSSMELVLFGSLLILYTNLSSTLVTFYGAPSIAKLIVGFMLLVLFFRRVVFGEEFTGWGKAAVLIGIYTLIGSLSLIYAPNFDVAKNTLIDYLKDGLIGLTIVITIRRPSTFRSLIWALLAAGIVMGTVSMFQHVSGTYSNLYWGFGQTSTSTDVGVRLEGSIGDPNFYAQILVCLVPLAIERFWNERKVVLRILALWAGVVCTYAIIFTYSRGGFIALLLACAILFIRRPPKPVVTILILLGLILSMQIFPTSFTARLSSLFSFLPSANPAGQTDTSLTGRSSENAVAVMIFMDHPILGIGLGNFNQAYQSYSRQLGVDARRVERSAHSLYLETLAERGLVGFLVLISILAITYRDLYLADKRFLSNQLKELADMSAAVASSLTGYLVAALFLHDAYQGYLWIILGTCWALVKISSTPQVKINGAGETTA